MADISDKEQKILKDAFVNMYDRYIAHKNKFKIEPDTINVLKDLTGDTIKLARFWEMLERWVAYKTANNGVRPNYIWIVKPKVTATPTPTPIPVTDNSDCLKTTLQEGSTGRCVGYAQTLLAKYGFYTAKVDEDFGPITTAAVIKFQHATGHSEDGVLGPKTWSSLPGYTGSTSPTGTVTSDGWTLTGTYASDYQDTSYTCGPSSLQMVFSALGRTVYEAYIAKLAGTGTAGTSHGGLATAVKAIDPSVNISEYGYSSTSFETIAAKLRANCEFIVHIQTGTLTKDAYGNSIWKNNYGHYVFLVGVNPSAGLIRIFDPTKGLVDFTYAQMRTATAAVVGQNSLLCYCK